MKKLLGFVLILMLVLTTGVFAEEDGIRIGLVWQNITTEMGSDMQAGAMYMANELGLKKEDVLFVDGESSLENQINAIDDLIVSGIDAIVIWPYDDFGIGQSIISCNEAGIPVVTVDVMAQTGEVVNHVASDNYEIGQIDGKYAAEYLFEKYGEYKGTCLAIGYPLLNSTRDRVQGFKDYMAQYENVKIEEYNLQNHTFDDGQAMADDLLQRYPEGSFDIFMGCSCAPGLGGCVAASTFGREDDYKVVCVDNIAQLRAECTAEKSALLGFVAQDPFDMGRTSVAKAVAAARGEDPGEFMTTTNLFWVGPETYDDFMAWYDSMCEKVADFR